MALQSAALTFFFEFSLDFSTIGSGINVLATASQFKQRRIGDKRKYTIKPQLIHCDVILSFLSEFETITFDVQKRDGAIKTSVKLKLVTNSFVLSYTTESISFWRTVIVR